MLTAGNWAWAAENKCLCCHKHMGARIVCEHCGYRMPDHLVPGCDADHVKAESVNGESTELVEAAEKPAVIHRYVGSFGD